MKLSTDECAGWEEQIKEVKKQAIREFVARVMRRAEQTIEKTNVVTGAHWNAINEEMRILDLDGDGRGRN